MNRRRLAFLMLGAALGGPAAFAAGEGANTKSAAVDVVKIFSFYCSISYASEGIDPAISAAAQATGGKFVWAPVMSSEGDTSGTKEELYYALRDVSQTLASSFRKSVFKGIQDNGLNLTSPDQLRTWVTQDQEADAARILAYLPEVTSGKRHSPLLKALSIAENAGVEQLPSYVLLVDGKIQAVVDPASVKAGSAQQLKEEVINRITKLNK